MPEPSWAQSRNQLIPIYTPPSMRLTCMRCDEPMVAGSVALYTRTTANGCFEPWCVDCAYTLVSWAARGAVELDFKEPSG